jgi:hypothetical protein
MKSRAMRVEITEWLVDGTSRGWSLNSKVGARLPARLDRFHLSNPAGQTLEAVVTSVVESNDDDRVVVFAEVRP